MKEEGNNEVQWLRANNRHTCRIISPEEYKMQSRYLMLCKAEIVKNKDTIHSPCIKECDFSESKNPCSFVTIFPNRRTWSSLQMDTSFVQIEMPLSNILLLLDSYHPNLISFPGAFHSPFTVTQLNAYDRIPQAVINKTYHNVTETNVVQQPQKRSDNNSVEEVRRKRGVISKVEVELSRARAAILKAGHSHNGDAKHQTSGYVPSGGIYRNATMFQRSYGEMEKVFKIFVYREGERPLVHLGPCKDIYSIEGRFIDELELGNSILTSNPEEAHVYFLPFSVVMMVSHIYKPKTYDLTPMKRFVSDYIDVISKKYPFWNRSLGADHFILSCHDWAPETSMVNPYLYNNSIRVLCNANTSEGFNPSKDATLPEVMLKGSMKITMGGQSAQARSVLAFFAGGNHGRVRPLLIQHWKGIDKDIQVNEYLPKGLSYYDMMKSAKYCLCPSGYEVASPRIVEAIYSGCVPVIISDHYVLPFSDVLNWPAFSVQVPLSQIPNLKTILQSISVNRYIQMQRRVIQLRRHFTLNQPPKRYDMFNMILHSIWLRRLNVQLPLK
ncbi:hypothetical protein SUGI_1028850 [Cryptomeria japonica]|uniref:probable glycosyltransferase At5g20260 n=1 Tax=Cryptomeria japonica TaxID=3369 RepID=UPI002414A5E9|nr:probable glycosyltransferase At5g20260 [Cryptomeria japonica]GLJ48789.1 hypothetical protein SUGI_1028850 [Cryptomeria japonica]